MVEIVQIYFIYKDLALHWVHHVLVSFPVRAELCTHALLCLVVHQAGGADLLGLLLAHLHHGLLLPSHSLLLGGACLQLAEALLTLIAPSLHSLAVLHSYPTPFIT